MCVCALPAREDCGHDIGCVLQSPQESVGADFALVGRAMATNPRHISINELLLDTHNPRVEPATAQRDEMQKLLDDQKDNLRVPS